LSNQQKEVPLRVRPLLRQLKKALEFLPGALPENLEEVSFVLVDRATMARVHGDFLGDATETDVITFPYGEILICPAVARDRAGEFGQGTEAEVLLYGLHGLLHLAGFDDKTPGAAKKMAQAQEELLGRVTDKFEE
jgi:probable rRNA maturation factor